jgi:hypothetical protein
MRAELDRPNQAFQPTAVRSTHVYEVRPRKDHRGVDESLCETAVSSNGEGTRIYAVSKPP